jgi:hypothetical protein
MLSPAQLVFWAFCGSRSRKSNIGLNAPSVHALPFLIATMTQERSEMTKVFADLPLAVDPLVRNALTACPATVAFHPSSNLFW